MRRTRCSAWPTLTLTPDPNLNPNPDPNPSPNPNPNPNPDPNPHLSPDPNPDPNQVLCLVKGSPEAIGTLLTKGSKPSWYEATSP